MSEDEKYICPTCKKEYKSYNGLSVHYSKTHNKSAEELYIDFKLNGDKPTCKCGCGKGTEFMDGKSGFKQYHSKRCQYNDVRETKKCPQCNDEFTVYKSLHQVYCSIQCRVDSEEVQKKYKEAMVQKYDVEHPSKSDEIKKKKTETNLERFGVGNPLQSEDIKEGIRQLNLEKYGVEHHFQSEDVNKKIKETNIKRYGVENPMQNGHILKKAQSTNLKRYGFKSSFENESVRQKYSENSMDKYGVDHPMKSEEVKNKRKKLFYEYLLKSDRLKKKVEPLFELDDYSGCGQFYEFKCNNCENIFEDHLNDGRIPRCVECYPYTGRNSKMEYELIKYLQKNDIEFEHGENTILDKYRELDIYLPEYEMAIEMNGLYWHSEQRGKEKNYHLNKTNECENKGISLFHIFEDEWLNNEDLIADMLLHRLNLSEKGRVYGRNTIVKGVSPKDKNLFLNKYHIQGEDRSSIKLGLYEDGELVSIMTFSKPRVALGQNSKTEDVWELSRFCSSKIVVGGASKLFTHFIRNHNPDEVYSYADRRRTSTLDGSVYDKLGFKKDSITRPNYWYVDFNTGIRYHRFNFRKNVLNEKLDNFDSDLTEYENMLLNGYDRIWDCGSIKYIWNN